MLTVLRIKNFAIVKELELDFAGGMTAFTGETGAGKSIMIDALMLALGERADAAVIRPGEKNCDITAIFTCQENSEPAQWLNKQKLDFDGEVILRRVLTQEGRSKSYINGQPFPLQKVKELSEMLVHIYGQHEHQTLMQHQTHRQHLDNFAGHHLLLEEVLRAYKRCQKIKFELEQLKEQDSQEARVDLLQFQIEELNNLALQPYEMDDLQKEHQLLHHAQDYIYKGQQLLTLLNADDQTNICQALNQCLQLVADLPSEDKSLKNAAEMLNNAFILAEEAHNEIKNFIEQISLNPERLHEVEQRLSLLHHTARKYHIDAHQLADHAQLLQQELDKLQNKESQLIELEKEYRYQLSIYQKTAEKLTQSRRQYAPLLTEAISSIIRQLGMPHGQISIVISPLEKMQVHGLDKIEYQVCTNPGMAPDSLSKIASGGELSRISLAIQMITAEKGSTPTLLFDEVDVGIGGATAALVGKLLRHLGERLQVFCVTHQPQVAASAHHHFLVEKHSDIQSTHSSIQVLDEPAKVNEIARMLGGIQITEQTRSHARELLAQQQ